MKTIHIVYLNKKIEIDMGLLKVWAKIIMKKL